MACCCKQVYDNTWSGSPAGPAERGKGLAVVGNQVPCLALLLLIVFGALESIAAQQIQVLLILGSTVYNGGGHCVIQEVLQCASLDARLPLMRKAVYNKELPRLFAFVVHDPMVPEGVLWALCEQSDLLGVRHWTSLLAIQIHCSLGSDLFASANARAPPRKDV